MTEIQWQDAIPGETLFKELVSIIQWGSDNAERSQQKALGPSEVGHPCDRRIAMSIMEEPKLGDKGDPLPSITGTAIHSWFEATIKRWNKHIGYERFFTERRVHPRPGLSGSCDLYDTETQFAIDLKNPNPGVLSKYRKADYPGEQYEVQLQEYGLGYANAGHEVKYVAIFALPRGGKLKDAWWWSSAYNPEIAHAAHRRLDEITLLADELDVEHRPERYSLIQTTPQFCDYCPYHSEEPVIGAHCLGEKKD